MSFRKQIPSRAMENPNVEAFVNVLDELLLYKQGVITDALRVFNPVLCTDKKWLIKELDSYGIVDFPVDLPLVVIQQFLLNVDTINRLRGSKVGVQLYCSVLTMGEVEVDDSLFYGGLDVLLLNSVNNGNIIGDSLDKRNYLVGNSEQLNSSSELGLTIRSKYYDVASPTWNLMVKYLTDTLPDYLPFSPGNQITFTYHTKQDLYFHELLNPYFA